MLAVSAFARSWECCACRSSISACSSMLSGISMSKLVAHCIMSWTVLYGADHSFLLWSHCIPGIVLRAVTCTGS